MKLVTKLNTQRAFGLADQIKRASLSIILNIAEGSSKRSDIDFARFLENATGSIREVASGFDVACDEKLISKEEYDLIGEEAEHINN